MELFNYYYNEHHVVKEEYIRLKKLEKMILQMIAETQIERDYRQWPLLKYHSTLFDDETINE